jgi:glycerol-3-phosphate dehydrogenase
VDATAGGADALQDGVFDVIVVGGGINGAGVARGAARAGLRVLLAERDRFGLGTSGKSSMLAHGGLRYLEQFEFRLVHESLQDREHMLAAYPDLVKPLRFLYPLYPHVAARRTVRVGMILYDVLSHGKTLPKRKWLSRDATLELAPGLNDAGLRAGATYYDAQIVDVPALVRRIVAEAHDAGAVCIEGAEVVSLDVEDGQCRGVTLTYGRGTLKVAARAVVNAAGPWVDDVLSRITGRADATDATDARMPPLIRKTKGVHIVVPRFVDVAIIVRAARDDRTFFVLPWNEHCLVGTTDTDFSGDARFATPDADDVAYLLDEARRYFPTAPLDEIRWAYAGVRPLVYEEGLTASNVTRRHVVHDHAADGVAGLWSLQGGKLTTFSSFGQMVVERVRRSIA